MEREPIVVERVLSAAPEVVYAAWGDAASLRSWMAPGFAGGATVDVDFRVGGAFRIVMHEAERDWVHHGEYLALEPPKCIVMTWVSDWAPAGEQRTLLRIDLEPVGRQRTWLVLTHSELAAGPIYDRHPHGWTVRLERLDAVLTGRTDACP